MLQWQMDPALRARSDTPIRTATPPPHAKPAALASTPPKRPRRVLPALRATMTTMATRRRDVTASLLFAQQEPTVRLGPRRVCRASQERLMQTVIRQLSAKQWNRSSARALTVLHLLQRRAPAARQSLRIFVNLATKATL